MLLLIHEAYKAQYQWDHFDSQLAKKASVTFCSKNLKINILHSF